MEQRVTYHFVWGPMRAKPCLIGRAAQRLYELIRERAEELDITVEDLVVFPDRVYVAVLAPAILSPHRIVCQFKAHSSHCLRHEFQEMTKIPAVWTRAYLVQAGEHVTPEQVLAAYEAAQPPRRRPGRPRSCDSRE
ncbi:MAG: IS200/IS605 family transposase [Chloroflexota bacterium]|nr:IS200/IS605 family transposase [Chloroflexota bacterium]